jgi:tetratricopeptide (TPR) repeat protein
MRKIIQVNYGVWLSSLFIFPFLQGGYFNYAVMLLGLVQSILIIVLAFNQHIRLRLDGIRIIIIGMFILSVISLNTPVDIGMHPFGILRMLIPLLTIILYDSFHYLYPKMLYKHLTYMFVLVGIMMSLFILLVLVIFPSGHPIITFLIQNNRMGGFFQYANTFGVYLFGILSLVVYMRMDQRAKNGLLVLLSSVIILSQSRTVFVILIVYTTILLISTKENRKNSVSILLGMLVGQILIRFLLPDFQTFRSFDLGLGAGELQSRLLYYEDGIKMISHKLSGYGYMGYYYVQRFFQTGATYRVRFIHSSILQASLDYGILAGGLLIALFIVLLKKIIRNLQIRNGQRMLAWIAITGYFLHSFVDFDFQFIAYVIFLFLFFLIVEEEDEITDVKARRLNPYIACMLLGLFVYFLIPSVYEYQGNYEKALEVYPYYTKAMTGRLEESKRYPKDFIELLERFVRQNEYYYEGFAFLREYYYNSGDLEKSLFYSYRCKELAPLWIINHERHVEIAYVILHGRYEAGVLSINDHLFYELFTMQNELEMLQKERANSYNIGHKAQFSLTPMMTRRISMAYQLYEFAMK